MTYVLQDAEIGFAFAEDQEQVDKLLEIADQIPALRHIFYLDPRGMRGYDDARLCFIDELLETGAQYSIKQSQTTLMRKLHSVVQRCQCHSLYVGYDG
jgi:long-chain acyl-CoA synthetase